MNFEDLSKVKRETRSFWSIVGVTGASLLQWGLASLFVAHLYSLVYHLTGFAPPLQVHSDWLEIQLRSWRLLEHEWLVTSPFLIGGIAAVVLIGKRRAYAGFLGFYYVCVWFVLVLGLTLLLI
jgi:hypothetical protein